jgi:hypothetical protein
MSNIQQLLNDFVMDYENPFKMYELAKEYDKLGQDAAAFTYYLRAAEFCDGKTYDEKLLQYRSLILGAKCFADQKNREVTVYSLLKMAITVLPNRPEAYYFMCNYCEENGEWRESLVYSSIGLLFVNTELSIGDNDIDYPGKQGLLYHNASGSWKDNGTDESKRLLFNVAYDKNIDQEWKDKSIGWLNNIGYPSYIPYEGEAEKYKFPFPGIEKVEKNYARHYQDMFVLSALDGKENGIWVEIGSGLPYKANNTALLEDTFNWKGLSIDNSERACYNYSQERKSTVVMADGKDIHYPSMFKQSCLTDWIDFLRINAEQVSLDVLKKIPFGQYEYGVIQFQHNACWWGPEFREESRAYLKGIGYVLAVNDVAMDPLSNYEDWWLHPQVAQQKPNMIVNGHPDKKNFIYDYVMKE